MIAFDSPFLAGLIGRRVLIGDVEYDPRHGDLLEVLHAGIVLREDERGVRFIPWHRICHIRAEPTEETP